MPHINQVEMLGKLRSILPMSGAIFFFLSISNFLNFYLFIYWLCWVFVAAQGLSLVAKSGGCSPVEVCRLLIVVASLAAEL